MSDQRHESIQRFFSGQSNPDETAELCGALRADPEMRALYLDYMNLDAALSAMADLEAAAERGAALSTADLRSTDRPSVRYWRWITAAAACLAVATLVVFNRQHDRPPAQFDIATVAASTRDAISRLPDEVPPVLPEWISPTASLLDQPTFPK